MKQVKTKRVALLLAALMMCSLFVTACSNNSTNADGAASSGNGLVVVGTQTNATKGIVLLNKLGGDISDVSLLIAGSKGDPIALPTAGTWADGTEALVFIPMENELETSDLTLKVGKRNYVLHDLDFATFDSGELCRDGKIGYLTYVVGDVEKSTLEHENDLISRAKAVKAAQKKKAEAEKKAAEEKKKAEEEKKAAEEAARAEAEAAAAAQAAAEAPQWEQAPADQQYTDNTYYEQPYDQSYDQSYNQTYDQQYTDNTYYEQPTYDQQPAYTE